MNSTEIEFIREYHNLQPHLKEFAKYVKRIIDQYAKSLLPNERIQKIYNPRVKDDESILNKAFYRRKNYDYPLKDITDKIGIRYVLLTTEDVRKLSDKINENNTYWDLIPSCTKKYLEDIFNNPNIFNYQSNHFVVKPKSNFFVDKNVDIDYITCEIQVRSLLQHAYSEVSHDSVYKGRFSHDRELIRILSRSMALIESTDENFEIIYDKMNDTKRVYIKFSDWLMQQYIKYDPSFKHTSYITELVDQLIVKYPEIIDECDKISSFEREFADYIKPAIKNRNELIFKQPASILAMYIVKYNRGSIRGKWPFSNYLIDEIFDALCLPREY